MSGPDALSIAAGLIVDVGLKSTALLALGGLGALLLRGGSAAQRHAVWAGTFAALPLLGLAAAQRGPAIALDAPWVAPLWLAGAVLAALPLLRGVVALVRLRRAALPDPQEPGLLHSATVAGPVTWGLLRPVIVLPAGAAAWPAAQRAAALAHEQAHVRRHDWAIHMAVWAISALFWFNPLAWLARRALAQEAEHAADDAALAAGVRPSDYAGLLVSLTASGRHAAGTAAALGAGSSPLGRRVRAVLEARPRSPSRAWALGLALSLGGGAASALGAWPAWTRPPDTLTCSPGPTP
jgi:beta-lactamase regulating signal transducer with metallopeptidase domain